MYAPWIGILFKWYVWIILVFKISWNYCKCLFDSSCVCWAPLRAFTMTSCLFWVLRNCSSILATSSLSRVITCWAFSLNESWVIDGTLNYVMLCLSSRIVRPFTRSNDQLWYHLLWVTRDWHNQWWKPETHNHDPNTHLYMDDINVVINLWS